MSDFQADSIWAGYLFNSKKRIVRGFHVEMLDRLSTSYRQLTKAGLDSSRILYLSDRPATWGNPRYAVRILAVDFSLEGLETQFYPNNQAEQYFAHRDFDPETRIHRVASPKPAWYVHDCQEPESMLCGCKEAVLDISVVKSYPDNQYLQSLVADPTDIPRLLTQV